MVAGKGSPRRRVMVLVRGANPSCDYYLVSRLARMDVGVEVIDTRSRAPADVTLDGALVIICRYLPWRWLRALRAARLAGLAAFVDDDYPAMLRDRQLPLGYRALVALQGLLPLRLLASRQLRLWVSTPTLARRFAAWDPAVIDPSPGDDDLAAPLAPPDDLLRYHAQLSHLGDHQLAADIVRRVLASRPRTRVEVIGPAAARPLWDFSDRIGFLGEMDWPAYRAHTTGGGGVLIAPLRDTAVNRSRAPTKAIDAARMGAAGLFAAGPASALLAGRVPLLAADPAAWAAALLALLDDADAFTANAAALRATVSGWHRHAAPLPL
ncbi:hypothetical protein [Ancylobacter oerskovii]|uniref:Glycosyltransferase involved in cell wall biosynthesis n=1 Tax=Ancylobacter oerskovii TaxID=459519 RepID=A0ABW4YW68_9HYPH|nr:hypothetical protein [Ancylobacter oerskovii]MBS7544286.1 hypothetical protein [Ancylobacter oerskovii]